MAKEGQKEFVSKDVKLKIIGMLQEFLKGIDPHVFSVAYQIDPKEELPFECIEVTISPSYAYINKIKLTFGCFFGCTIKGDNSISILIDIYSDLGVWCSPLAIKDFLLLKEVLRDMIIQVRYEHMAKGAALDHLLDNANAPYTD